MQRMINFWKSGLLGKIILFSGFLIGSCCLCLGSVSIMDALGLIPTSTPTLVPTITFTSTATLLPTLTLAPTETISPTNTATLIPFPTDTLTATATLLIVIPTQPQSAGVCSCSGDLYNCSRSDFSSKSAAQACYNYCISLGVGDVHGLDRDGDGTACDGGLN